MSAEYAIRRNSKSDITIKRSTLLKGMHYRYTLGASLNSYRQSITETEPSADQFQLKELNGQIEDFMHNTKWG